MQQLKEWCDNTPIQMRHATLESKIIELLETERQQIINACEAAPMPSTWNADYKTFGEQYYNNKYNTPERDKK